MIKTKFKYAAFLIALTLFAGCSSNEDNSEENIPVNCLKIGDSYQGGIIFYIDHTNEHGLIAAPMDQSGGAPWGCEGTTSETAVNRDIGFGQENTQLITTACNDNNIAAKLCEDLVLSGYDDWFLPSLHELEMAYHYRNLIGGFSTTLYSSSSELKSSNGIYNRLCAIDFSNTPTNPSRLKSELKSTPLRVRAIRKF